MSADPYQPETVAEERSFGPVTTTANGSGQAGLVNTATGAAGALAGWAYSSLTKQLSSNEVHSSMSAAPATASLQVPVTNGHTGQDAATSSRRSSTDSTQEFAFGATSKPSTSIGVRKAAPPVRSSGSGMKLGGTAAKAKPTSLVDTIAGEWDEDDDAANAWGNEDLIDVNADDDDWAAFESAPVVADVVAPPQSYYVTPPPEPKPSPVKPAPIIKAASAPSPPKVTHAPAVTTNSRPISPAPAESWGDEEEPTKSTTPLPSLAGMSKEDKDKEMARRREERKAVSTLLFVSVVKG